jgi:hypothetical protein
MIRAWNSSIGNLRAWPLQANRGDGADAPRRKLTLVKALKPFGITSKEQLLEASFLDVNELSEWSNSAPEEPSPGYLGKPSEFGECRKSLVRAIIRRWRWLGLYRDWYEALRVEELGP